jgi:hypothetical protein
MDKNLNSVISKNIHFIRGQRVMLDSDLAELYEVPAKRLNEQVKRNSARFPADFMFQLNTEEYDFLRSQSATLKRGRGKHRKFLPFAFTEQGVAMLSSVLNSKRSVQVNIEIMRAFIQLRGLMAGNTELKKKLFDLEKKYDVQFKGSLRCNSAIGKSVFAITASENRIQMVT